MDSMNIKDLVIPKVGYIKHVNEIMKNFKKTINREIPRRQEENLKKLASLFLNDVKIDKPIVVNLDIGQGKSALLLEFIKYIYEIDSTFSTVIVKRTLQEGREFCINTGLKDNKHIKDLVNSSDNPTKKLEDIYYGDIEEDEKSGADDEFPLDESGFIARLIRGFNYKDCLEYKDPNKEEGLIGELPENYREYSPVLCEHCTRTCGAKLSKWTVDKHPAIVITHQRLFLSNDLDKIMDCTSGRKVLIIDEKIQTTDVGNILLEQWEGILTKVSASNSPNEIKESFKKIGSYLNNIQFPERSDATVPISPYDSLFKFDGAVYGILRNDNDIKDLVAVEKFLNYGGTTSRSWHNSDKKQFSYIRYIDLENYTKHFEKTIILDATSARNGEVLDEDYKKSNVVFLTGLNETARGKINLYHSSQKTTKSSLIHSSNAKTVREKNQFRNLKGDKEFYLTNVQLIANEIQDIITATNAKTLIICYKSIMDKYGNIFKFEDDINKMLKFLEVDSNLYSVKHFGAATTGVNDFREYKNIVFVGMLNKGSLYYTNKTVAIGSENPEVTELSEYIIDCIQQIGRICVREGEEANVYMLFEDRLGLTKELKKHFILKEKDWLPKHFNGINNATVAKQNTCWYAVINELEKMKDGNILSLTELQDVLESQFKADTVYRQISHPQVETYMEMHLIAFNRNKKYFKKN